MLGVGDGQRDPIAPHQQRHVSGGLCGALGGHPFLLCLCRKESSDA